MAVRLEPQDEYMHELGPEPNFNESMYFNLYDPAQGVGGWFRCGNRAMGYSLFYGVWEFIYEKIVFFF